VSGQTGATPEWEKDIQEVAKTLKSKYGFKLKEDQIRLPPHDKVKELCPPFRWDDLEQVMTELQEGWQIEFSDDPVRPNHKRVELVRDFVFQSFEQAMEFMAGVGKFASESNHHPRWMNLWNTVRVWLSTWDVGSRITPLDTQLARYMEWKYDKIKFEHTPH
jgi:pterin-4a-carbinolamine dehydratase